MKKPKIFNGEVFKITLHQLSKHDSKANFTIKTCEDSIKGVSTYWIDDLIKQLKKVKRELKKNHVSEIVEGETYYSMKAKQKEFK